MDIRVRVAEVVNEVVNDMLSPPKHQNKSPLERADQILALIISRVQGIENPNYIDNSKPFTHMDKTDADYAREAGFNEAIQKVLEVLK